MDILEEILAESASRHKSLCPRQVLGSRVGLAGAAALNMDVPRSDKRLLVIVETDGCFVSGVETVTGCGVNHRTLRVEDYGKIAATFINVKTGEAVRVAPRLDVRQRARDYAPDEKRRYYAMLKGYQEMPTEELLSIEEVVLTTPVETIVSRAGVRVNCDDCGEEIINEREVVQGNRVLCRACASPTYYQAVSSSDLLAELLLADGTEKQEITTQGI
ncbi:MAG: formylmethanofuran dehydrogenase [Anaerolineae bacterium]|jgi:formylmethanofuran dehydrogenase subunit E|nr:formylmethanofuran dehydrogenase [Anaerolineae bacterium]MBT7191804.1 formylmethanofuran dehydrogenase [Anaerolineae bacterium]MBT7991972.1 formylmethanofuran dehydrogenase [Anaerolineae bacterium]